MIDKIIKYLGWAVFLITAILAILFFVKDAPGLGNELSQIEGLSAIEKQQATADIATNWGATLLNFAGIMLFICVGLVVAFVIYKFVYGIIFEPKSVVKSLISLAFIGVLVLIAYLFASDAIPVFLGSDKLDITPKLSKWIDTGLFSFYIMFGLAFVLTIYGELSRMWK
ncbi:MAG: EscU/YscU/HrcU family type III secretion system export apparatus switch protein [Bacteroidales bacterium]|nr:EscU/YscU/HrcU family type III secretion system export apparatus switch protein [Bacteroidales bacterium]